MDMDNSVVIAGGGVGKGGREYGGINGDGKRLDLGWGTQNAVYG